MANCRLRQKEKILGILDDFSQSSTIAGLHYAVKFKESFFASLIWMSILIVFTCLFVYTSNQSYRQWRDEPVLTTVATTGLPIDQVPFPSVVICPQGLQSENVKSFFYKIVFDYLYATNGIKIETFPLVLAKYFKGNEAEVITKFQIIK